MDLIKFNTSHWISSPMFILKGKVLITLASIETHEHFQTAKVYVDWLACCNLTTTTTILIDMDLMRADTDIPSE